MPDTLPSGDRHTSLHTPDWSSLLCCDLTVITDCVRVMKNLLIIVMFSLTTLLLVGASLLETWYAQMIIGRDEDQRACPGLASQRVVDGVIHNLMAKRETPGEWYLLSRDEIIINPADVQMTKTDFFVPFHYTRKPGIVYDVMGGCAYPDSVEYSVGHPG